VETMVNGEVKGILKVEAIWGSGNWAGVGFKSQI